ncbi:glutathione peroxidase [Alicyclobacillus pomorum]|jgi:glutathione peroxidase|uniref:glutathione peroxidase n=1 Tax=Alicyclobacillus pomorum TaxID=204470 RepID=UPI0003FF12BC|nr:glutathione peroxidase [Alicyclobacillus pomorum]
MTVYDFHATTIDGRVQSLEAYRGKVLLIVNTASRCGFTPQYQGLQALYEKYRDQGFVVLGFPCNQFGHQEPGDNEEIQTFCSLNYNVSFPMFAKVDVKGDTAHPLFQFLTQACPGVLSRTIKWNFTKFLVDGDGQPVRRFAPTTPPEKLEPAVEQLLSR